ncbi:MAG: type 4b pilus protein PilO2 [Alphaproteobacteria bacterium]|nr:type 4b pilus protein PilO2 [Alphaproteobacteria bacterium]
MAAGIVTVGRHSYVVGLYWENSPGGGRVSQIAKEAARQPGQQADFYTIRPGNKDGRVPQFGLCSGEAGQKAGMAVLAGCLAGQIPGSWAGAFRLKEGVAVTIIRDELIVPDGDLLFTDEAEARDRLIQEIGFGGLQTIYAPEAWSIPGADTIPLTLLLNDRRDIQLQCVDIPKKAKIITAGLAAAFLIGLAGFWFVQERDSEREALLLQQQAALRRAQQEAHLPDVFEKQAAPEPKYERKWESEPTPLAFIDACKEGLAHIPAALNGWKLTSLTCSGGSISLAWNHQKVSSEPPAGANVDEAGSSATKTIPLAGLKPRGAETLLNIDDITNRYLIQNWPGSIAHAPDDPLPPPPPDYKGQWNPPPAPWVKRSFTLNVPELPGGLPGMIGDLPGVIINSMSCAPGGTAGTWTIEGVIYENRK